MNPLDALPAELVLRILEVASLGSIAALSRASRSWNAFIQLAHQDTIYAAHLPGAAPADPPTAYLRHLNTLARLPAAGIASWKEACRRYYMLHDAWTDPRPEPRSSVVQVGSRPVWRFKPDFQRRFIVSTSQAGGASVTDMDTGQLLWSLGQDQVRPFAHLEYQDGVAVWDRYGNSLEVWKTGLAGLARGEFRMVALLPHDTDTRGFQLSLHTLCVASSEGEAFVYDLPPASADQPVALRTHMTVAEGAIGHLYQDQDAVLFSMGHGGFDFHDKSTGHLLGHMHPSGIADAHVYHFRHPAILDGDFTSILRMISGLGGVVTSQPGLPFGPQGRRDRLTPLQIRPGPLPPDQRRPDPDDPPPPIPPIEADEWGAGMLHGDTMVGISRGGRFVVCSDWRRALKSPQDLAAVTAVVEGEPSSERDYDLGGWLAIHETIAGKRVIFEMKHTVYLVALGHDGGMDIAQPAFSISQGIAPQVTVPVSFMGVYDDCLMTTFTTLGMETEDVDDEEEGEEAGPVRRERYFPTKAIRILSFAPDMDGDERGSG